MLRDTVRRTLRKLRGRTQMLGGNGRSNFIAICFHHVQPNPVARSGGDPKLRDISIDRNVSHRCIWEPTLRQYDPRSLRAAAAVRGPLRNVNIISSEFTPP